MAMAKKIQYVCHNCGAPYEDRGRNFYKTSPYSRIWVFNEGYVPICRSCIQRIFEDMTKQYGKAEIALKAVCHYLDWPYVSGIYNVLANDKNGKKFSLVAYYRQIANNPAYAQKTFINTIMDGALSMETVAPQESFDESDVWSAGDAKNREFCITTYGYDPLGFEPGMSDKDKKYVYNILAGYCDADGITEDMHKLMCALEMAKLFLQIKKFDDEINLENSRPVPDGDKIKTLMSTKKMANDQITSMARDNNISSAFNKQIRAGTGTMSDKEKEMLDAGYEPSKPNLYDIKTSAVMQQIAEISVKAMDEKLSLDENDMGQIIRDQRENLKTLRSSNDRLSEENRQLKNAIIDARSGKIEPSQLPEIKAEDIDEDEGSDEP